MRNSSDSQYDAAIVLANQMDAKGNLNHETRERVDLAVEALRDRRIPLLVTCGWAYREDSEICIADAMSRYAMTRWNVPASSTLAETMPRDTVGEAVFTKLNLAVPRQWSHILVVTSLYHVARTHEIFTLIYGPLFQIDVIGAGEPATATQQASEAKSLDAFRRTFENLFPGEDREIIQRLRQRHPFYNGDVHPKI
jgi:hypothetical protein